MRIRTLLAASLLILGCAAGPTAHADESYGPGSYTVPGRMPHGVYTAYAEQRDPNRSDCSFSTWTGDDKFIYGDNVPAGRVLVANLSATTVAKFITHGCTPWTKVQ